MVRAEGRILGAGVAESHSYGVEAAALQWAASGLVKMFMVTRRDWELENLPLLEAPKKAPRFRFVLIGRKGLPLITETGFLPL